MFVTFVFYSNLRVYNTIGFLRRNKIIQKKLLVKSFTKQTQRQRDTEIQAKAIQVVVRHKGRADKQFHTFVRVICDTVVRR